MTHYFVAIACLLVAGTASAQDVGVLNLGSKIIDQVIGGGSERLYQVTPGANQHLVVLLEKEMPFSASLDLKFKAVPTDEDRDDHDGGQHDLSDHAVEIALTKTGSYFIRVRAECCEMGGRYRLTAYTLANMPQLPIGAYVAGRLNREQAEKVYHVAPGAGQHLFVFVYKSEPFASALDLNFKFVPDDVDHDAADGGERDATDQAVEVKATKAGDYFVRLRAACCDTGGPYEIIAHTSQTLPDLNLGMTLEDAFPEQGSERYYRVTAPAGALLNIFLTKPEPFSSRLEASFGQLPTDLKADVRVGGSHATGNQTATITATKAGVYYIRASATCCEPGGDYMIAAGVTAPTEGCTGDCDRNGEVTIDELLSVVNIGLGARAVTSCASADTDANGEVTIDELIIAVGKALSGCS